MTNAVFTVIATGTSPLAYEWRFNGNAIPGANQSSYTRSTVQTNDAGNYSVAITNLAGLVTSSNAVLTVLSSQALKFDLITLLPANQIGIVLSGEPGSYSIQSASNFVDWLAWTNVTISNAPIELRDTIGAGRLQQFYRATSP